ncbi:serine-rich adhesin for platelets isoform X1 [Oreochromis aureus]|uniref:RAB11 family interacting protein 5a (class I) n=1 Tax=Oreochromis aureus TaxID=47969 RepID=A0A668T5Q7_OREAU|nr:serine-rich adhesin for platelets isoform X1 [Oreochromis aureus]
MSSLNVQEDQKWVPTHVQVTVLRGRGLRGKGKHGTSDVYTIIQLGKEKYSTGVAEKTTEPEWKEECSFELQPGVLESGGQSGYPAGSCELILTVMHRALIGLDVFLGQAVIPLDKVFLESRCVKNEWYRLNSKTGKKEKERGDIQVTIQFTRDNLTASMYDLVIKDKGASTFSKLKERMKGKRRSSDEDSSSAVLPSGYGSLYRMRQRLPSDGGGEEDYEDDEGGEVRRSKMRTFFLRGKLRKSSDTRSSTSLGSESSESSSRGGSLSPTAGISVVVSDLSNSPSNSSNLTGDNSPEHTANTSPKSSSLKCEFGDEAGEITIAVPQPTVCINGSHSYKLQPQAPGSGKPAGSLGLGLLQKSMPLSVSLQNLSQQASIDLPKSGVGDGRRWSFDKPGEEEKAAIAAALEKSGPMLGEKEERLGQAAPTEATSWSFASTVEGGDIQGKKQRRNFFSHAGKGQSQPKDESERAHATTDEKQRGRFGSKDSQSKPSLVVSPKLEPSTDPHSPPLPPSHHPLGRPVEHTSVVPNLHHTNPFCHSPTSPPPISQSNPFFSLIQHNPFYEDMITAQQLKPTPPPLPYLSSSRPPIAQLFPQPSNSNSVLSHGNSAAEESISAADVSSTEVTKAGIRGLPPTLVEGKKPLLKKSSNPFMSVSSVEPDSEWDESFEAFAAGRLQSPEDLSTGCKTQQKPPSDHLLEHCNNKADRTTNVTDALHHHQLASQVTNTNMHYLNTFPQFLETIPEHRSFEHDDVTLNSSTNSLKLNTCSETNQDTSATSEIPDTNVSRAPCHTLSVQLSSSSPDPSSSGLGSSAEEDFLSCVSSYSDKVSASSSEETESNIFGLVKTTESTDVKNKMGSESEDDTTYRSNDLSLVDVVQQTVIEPKDSGKVDLSGSAGSLAPLSTVLGHLHPSITKEIGTDSADAETLNNSNIVYLDLLPELSEPQLKSIIFSHSDNEGQEGNINDLKVSIGDFSKELNDGSKDDNIKVRNPATSDQERSSTLPSLHITTSSPDVKQASLVEPFEGARLAGQDASPNSHVPFSSLSDLLDISQIANSPSQDFGDTQLHRRISDQSSSSFLQSLNVSIDSQDYQTCVSHSSSKSSSVSEPNETMQLKDVKTTAGAALGLMDSTNASESSNGEIGQTDKSEATPHAAQDKTTTLEPTFPIEDLQSFPAAQPDSFMSCNLKSAGEVSDAASSICAPTQNVTLHRSQSEGTLATPFDEVLLPSFGSDPGGVQGSTSSQPGPDLPSLISFAPSLAPESICSPVALSTFSPFANASARLPPSSTQATAPKPVPMPLQQEAEQQQQQQAANQQNSPHPVKPLPTAMQAEEKRSVLATGLEKLKSTIHHGRSSQLTEQESERKKSLTEGAGSYYHLTHSELVNLLVQREAELERQKAEYERQKLLLAKRETELKKLKPQVRDLEDYIDTLLVRIMEQKPTLLQVRSKFK